MAIHISSCDSFPYGSRKTNINSKKIHTSKESYTSRSKFRGGGTFLNASTPGATTIVFIYLLICIIHPETKSQENSCSYVPKRLTTEYCVCSYMSGKDTQFLRLVCKGLNTAEVFSPLQSVPANSKLKHNHHQRVSTNHVNFVENENLLSNLNILSEEESAWINVKQAIGEVIVRESDLGCVDFRKFNTFTNLKKLVITNSKVTKLNCDNKNNIYESDKSNLKLDTLTHLDLSGNAIRSIQVSDFEFLPNMQNINLSRNLIEHLEDVFSHLTQLETLDLSSNHLNANLKKSVFDGINKSIENLYISGKSDMIKSYRVYRCHNNFPQKIC